MSAARREILEIYADILRVVEPGARKSRIVYKANLSFDMCGRYLDKLHGMGLIEASTDPHPTWAITERGREFLEKHRELRGWLSPNRKGGAGTARVRIELDSEIVKKLRDALERAEAVEEEKPAE